MLDSPTVDNLSNWSHDAECLAAGDDYIVLALRCFAAALLPDAAIRRRLLDYAGGPEPPPAPDIERDDAAVAFARHCAMAGVPMRQTIVWLARLSVWVPDWPDDPDEIAAIAREALREMEP